MNIKQRDDFIKEVKQLVNVYYGLGLEKVMCNEETMYKNAYSVVEKHVEIID